MPPISPASRSGPLITWLVVFALLWVVGTVFAIYYYVDGNKAREDLDNVSKQYSEVLPRSQISSELESARAIKGDPNAETNGFTPSMSAFDVLKKQRDDLAAKVDGGARPEGSFKNATDAMATAAAQAKSADVPSLPPTLTAAVDSLVKTLVARKAEADGLKQQLKQAQEGEAAAKQQMQANQEALSKAVDEMKAEAAKTSDSFNTDRTSKDAQVQKMMADSDAAQKVAQDQIAQAATQISDISKERDRLKALVDQLQTKLGVKRANTSDSIIRQADGTVVRVPGTGAVYINLGAGDQISPGLTFEVYDRNEGIPALGDVSTDESLPKGKGSIEVVHVGAGTSECRIINQMPGMSIHENDLIANLIYDRNTRYQFMVYGDFDLDQNGVSTPADADGIKRLITQWGGKITDRIDANADFLVLGKEPTVLTPTKEELTDPIMQAKAQASQAAYDQYQDTKKQAQDYHIPILNQNRFLYYVGFYESAKR